MGKMLKTLAAQIRQYRKATITTPLLTVLEVVMEVLIPMVMASIIDDGIEKGDMGHVFLCGGIMLVMAAMSLFFGILGGRTAAYASSGFACNLRDSLFTHIQEFSFHNIDRFSTAGLVTRLTTDVTNIQNAFQMVMRICVRAPIMLVTSLVLAIIINPKVSLVFVGAILVLAPILFAICRKAMPLFDKVFDRYDELNASV